MIASHHMLISNWELAFGGFAHQRDFAVELNLGNILNWWQKRHRPLWELRVPKVPWGHIVRELLDRFDLRNYLLWTWPYFGFYLGHPESSLLWIKKGVQVTWGRLVFRRIELYFRFAGFQTLIMLTFRILHNAHCRSSFERLQNFLFVTNFLALTPKIIEAWGHSPFLEFVLVRTQ